MSGDKYDDSMGITIDFPPSMIPYGWDGAVLTPTFTDGAFTNSVKLNVAEKAGFGTVLVTNIGANTLPARYKASSQQGAQLVLNIGTDYVPGQTITLQNILSFSDGSLVAAASHK